MKKIDANVVLRYVLNDHPELSSKAREIIDRNIVEIPIEVLCEVVYVLAGYYGIDRKSISTGLQRFFNKRNAFYFTEKQYCAVLNILGKNH